MVRVIIEQKGLSANQSVQLLEKRGSFRAKAGRVVRIDLHVHTNRSPEGIHGLGEIVSQAKRMGLDGIAITDHNRLLPRRAAAHLSKIYNFLVIGGIEGGDLVRRKNHGCNAHRHWIGLNIDEAQFGHDIQAITETIREEGGISIAPHPYARNGYRNYESLGFDAVEGLNGTRTGEEVTSRGLARVGGTDAHAKYMLGSTWTEVYGSNGSVESILENIRKGNCVPRGSWIPLRMIAKFYLALVGRYVLHEPCELLQNGSNRLRKYC